MYDLECKDCITSAIIIEKSKDSYVIRVDESNKEAKKAFSCLIVPEVGDFVSIFESKNELYITNILSRVSSDMKIECLGSMEIRSNSINIYASTFNSYFENVKNFFNSMQLSGLNFDLKAAVLKTFSKTNENTHIEVTNKYDRSFTYINEIEEVQTKLSRHLVEENKIVKANNILATAKNQVKIDGENISLA